MTRSVRCFGAIAAVISVAALTAAPAFADTIFEVENARANARAGGPVSNLDAELLNRWGALSGTPGWRHRYSERFDDDDTGYQRWWLRSHRRAYHH